MTTRPIPIGRYAPAHARPPAWRRYAAAPLLHAVAMLAAMGPLAAQAQAMVDPTRPPAAVTSAAPAAEGKAGGGPLQSVLIAPTGRLAIIGGQQVKEGGTYGDAKVVSISETEVVLRSEAGTETLRLYPQVDLRPIRPAAAAVPPEAPRKPAATPSKAPRRKP